MKLFSIFLITLLGMMPSVRASNIDSTLNAAELAVRNQHFGRLEGLSKEFIKYNGVEARMYESYYLGVWALNTREFEASKSYFLKSKELAEELGDSCYLGKSLHYLSLSYFNLYQDRDQIKTVEEIIKKKLPCVSLSKDYLSIGAAYRRLKSFDTARTYLEMSLKLGKVEEPRVVPFVLNHIGDIVSEQGNKAEAIRLRRNVVKWMDTAKFRDHKYAFLNYLSNSSRDYFDAGLNDSGIYFYNRGMQYSSELNSVFDKAFLLNIYAGYWFDQKQYDSANYYYLKAFSSAERGKNKAIRQSALDNIQIALGNKLLLEELKSQKASLQRNISIVIGAGVLLLSLLLIRLARQRIKHQQVLRAKDAEVHQKELEGLLAGQEVQVVEALVEGQEHERKRLSQELHDTIGSMLATLKLQFESLTELFEVSNDKQESKIEFTNDLLDRTCIEVRRISHNLSSGMVSKVGVVEAIRQVSNNINSSGKLAVEFVTEVEDINLQGDAAVHLFRVVQELFSNIIKHSKATKLSVQISAFENEVTLIIEDNGVGFDYQKALREGKGLGLSNLATRVQQLNGELNVDSAIGRGTTAIIELKV